MYFNNLNKYLKAITCVITYWLGVRKFNNLQPKYIKEAWVIWEKVITYGNTFSGIVWSILDRLKPFLVGVSIQNLKVKENKQNTTFH